MTTLGELSILIPTYNHDCVALVRDLQRQAARCEGLRYEILVSDDGSTDTAILAANRVIETLPHCRYLRRDINAGRAATRNLLARSAQYDHLLFIDSHMSVISDDYLTSYLKHTESDVVYGGYQVGSKRQEARGRRQEKGNLRYRYEVARHHVISIEERQAHPYRDFHTSNFMVSRTTMLSHPFDERFRRYGYEDVFFGKQLAEAGISILHVDNPVGFDVFEDNELFLQKTSEGLHTLWEMRKELGGYSRLLTKSATLHRWHLGGCIRLWHRLFGNMEHRNLLGRHPRLWIFDLWRMGEFFRIQCMGQD